MQQLVVFGQEENIVFEHTMNFHEKKHNINRCCAKGE